MKVRIGGADVLSQGCVEIVSYGCISDAAEVAAEEAATWLGIPTLEAPAAVALPGGGSSGPMLTAFARQKRDALYAALEADGSTR